MITLDEQLDKVIDLPSLAPTKPKRPFLVPTNEHPDDYILYIDNSSLELSNTCNRKMEYYTVTRREQVGEVPALNFGTAEHKGTEMLRRGAPLNEVENYLKEFFEQHPVHVEEFRNLDRAVDSLRGWWKRYKKEEFTTMLDASDEPMIERPFAIELGMIEVNAEIAYKGIGIPSYIHNTYIVWTGRLDELIVWEGSNWVRDLKTTTMMGPTYWDSFLLSSQMMGYIWAAEKMTGEPFVGLLLDVIYIRPATKAEPTGRSEFPPRQRYYYNQEHIKEWERDTLANIGDFVGDLVRGYFPKKTAWCISKYGRCPYLDVCTLPPEQRATMLQSNLYQDVTWSPLD